MTLSLDLTALNHANVVVIGDVMLDSYWSGNTQRISPEAPVPVVHVQDHYQRPGGAANVALNLSALGSNVTLLGVIGDDEAGRTLQSDLNKQGVCTDLVVSKTDKTITKLRIMSRHQQLIRLDTEDGFHQFNHEALLEAALTSLDSADVVIISDYNKGTLRPILKELLTVCKDRNITTLVDPKGDDFSIYENATLLTPNMSEFEVVAGKPVNEEDFEMRAHQLMQHHKLQSLLVTRSEKGMSLFQTHTDVFSLPAQVREVFDVTGAGDTVIATLAAGVAAGYSLHDAVRLANLAAGIVVGKMGTATASQHELQVAIAAQEHSQVSTRMGIVELEELIPQVALARSKGESIVFTNGCFDIIHAGHVHYLQEARKLGDRLIVGVNSDDSISRLKGPTRPVNTLANRMTVLAALQSVDWVVPFSDDTPAHLIDAIVPDKLIKGGDYKPENIVGYDTVTQAGGEVKVIDVVEGCSTSNIIEKILKT